MKHLIFVLLLLPFIASAQLDPTSYPSNPGQYGNVGQMLNLTNLYYGKVPANAYPTTQMASIPYVVNGYKDGPYSDTLTNAGTLNLTICTPGAPWAQSDTLLPLPLIGNGSLFIVLKGTNISGTTKQTINIKCGVDGVTYGSILPDNTTQVTADSIAGTYTFQFKDKVACYWQANIIGSGTQSTTWKAYYYFRKPYFYGYR